MFWQVKLLGPHLSADHAALLPVQEDVEQRPPQAAADVLTAGTESSATAGNRGQRGSQTHTGEAHLTPGSGDVIFSGQKERDCTKKESWCVSGVWTSRNTQTKKVNFHKLDAWHSSTSLLNTSLPASKLLMAVTVTTLSRDLGVSCVGTWSALSDPPAFFSPSEFLKNSFGLYFATILRYMKTKQNKKKNNN